LKSLKVLLAAGGGAAVCALLLAQTLARASRPDGIDLTSYLLSARAVLHGHSPYQLDTPFPYLYPATLAFLLIPLALVPHLVAVVAWFAVNVAAVVWSVRAVVVAVESDLERRPGDLAAFLAVFCTFFFTVVQSNLRNGQVNFVVLALCVVALAASRAALFFSLAIAVKLVPLALVPYFALRRPPQWIVASLLLTVGWCLLPAVTLGGRVVDVYQQYWRVFLASSLLPRAQPLDFSLAGTIAAAAGTTVTSTLRVGAAIVVFVALMVADARRFRGEHARPFALYLLAIPLVSPQSEVHHLAFMLPAAAVVAGALWANPHQTARSFRIVAAVAAVLYLAATASPRSGGPLFCAALIVTAVAVANSHRRVRLNPDATDVEPQTAR
jgi:alpha-1,2-mannosyltransferase